MGVIVIVRRVMPVAVVIVRMPMTGAVVVVVVGCRPWGGRLQGGKVSAHGVVLKTLK